VYELSYLIKKKILTFFYGKGPPCWAEVRTQKKLGFWIGFGWETQNPKKIQKSKIQTQKKSKIQKIQNPNPKNIQIQFFFLLFKIGIKLI
jgi:hypothetical protein